MRIAIASSVGGLQPFAPMVALIRELERRGLRKNVVAYAGSSGGSVFSSLAASGMPGDKMREALLGITSRGIWEDWNRGRIVTAALRTLTTRVFLGGFTGLIEGNKIRNWLYQQIGHVIFEDLPTPLYVSAFNINLARGETFGPHMTTLLVEVAKAVRGSTAIPFGFVHETIKAWADCLECGYWDGGVTCSLPLLPLLQCQADIILAIDAAEATIGFQPKPWVSINDLTPVDMLSRMVDGLAESTQGLAFQVASVVPIHVLTVREGASMSNPGGTIPRALQIAEEDIEPWLDQIL